MCRLRITQNQYNTIDIFFLVLFSIKKDEMEELCKYLPGRIPLAIRAALGYDIEKEAIVWNF